MNVHRLLEGAEAALLALAISAIWIMPDKPQISAALTTAWILVGLCGHTRSKTWAFAVGAILLLNLRGIVLAEGPRPVSHMDYVLLIAGFLSGQGKSLSYWRWQTTSLCLAVAAGAALMSREIIDHLFVNNIQGFKLGFLLINQTALLAGLACVSGVAAFQLSKSLAIRLPIGVATGLCAFMVLGTHSRAGLGLIPITLLMAWALRSGALERLGKTFKQKRCRAATMAGTSIAVISLVILGATHKLAELTRAAAALYGQENIISDQGRLNLWQCYASLPFSGDNRFLFGVGYGKARQLCQIFLPGNDRPLSHAHNLPLQIWAEAGTLPLVALLIAVLILGIRLWRQQSFGTRISGLTGLLIYALAFNLLELGMLKVPLLTALFGHLLATALTPPQQASNGQDATSLNASRRSVATHP